MSPESRRRRTQGSRVALLAVVALAAAIVFGVLLLVDGDDDPAPGEFAADPGVSHVHGLGINPADGSLIVATHYGSFRIPRGSGDAERIGDSFQDTMGFTVAGPDHFLGSGHPDIPGFQAGQPTRLGLIESLDAGATWTILSLGDEVDFHALAYIHDQVYGWDSGTGRFMVSTDRTTWDTRSTLDLYGFAVDPDDPDLIVAGTPEGLRTSTDGGGTWTDTDGPQLVALSWDPGVGLWGADSGGNIWRPDGADWNRAGGMPGEPQAFLVTPDALYAAAHDNTQRTGIYRSTDNGRTWDLIYQAPTQ